MSQPLQYAIVSDVDKRSSIFLVLIGLLMIAPVAVLLLPMDPINSTGPGYFPSLAVSALTPLCGIAVIFWGVPGLIRKGPRGGKRPPDTA